MRLKGKVKYSPNAKEKKIEKTKKLTHHLKGKGG
jgi:hypothetical protein